MENTGYIGSHTRKLKRGKEDVLWIFLFFKFEGWRFPLTTVPGKTRLIAQSTTIDADFDRPLAAYNDTTSYNGGLYEVGKRMIKETFPKIIIS